ncbi:diacylglycerol kinase [Rhodospirillum rubrum]|uniref:diacylglycerol/lipid kinase family protein n=1 Tax=Rhodospirillum rubrum TaxID=1085 RepID=UPI001904A489|nr:diacylglycerol kinase family protein [Rhodospirillum rubrum]MBK1666205.1 diacylglycerol kinase [Rhodospirillum rubrum]MBK1678190.1 diacylglycerol kinase [Rhodospirillum rubrum]
MALETQPLAMADDADAQTFAQPAEPRPAILVLLNRSAGGLIDSDPDEVARDLGQRLEALLAERAVRVDLRLLEGGALVDTLDSMLNVQGDRPAAVLVGGGDGTVLAIASRLIGSGIPLGILPLGTLNLLARDLLIPLDMDAALSALLDGVQGEIDVARINGAPFLNLTMLGIKSSITRIRERNRGGLSPWHWLRMAWHALKLFRRAPREPMTLETPQGTRKVRAHGLAVANNGYADRPGLLVSRDHLNGGALAIYIGRHRGLLSLGRQLLRLVGGRWQHDPELDHFTTSHLVIHTKRPQIHTTVDGEPRLLPTPLTFTLERAALTVLAHGEAARRLADPRPGPLARPLAVVAAAT